MKILIFSEYLQSPAKSHFSCISKTTMTFKGFPLSVFGTHKHTNEKTKVTPLNCHHVRMSHTQRTRGTCCLLWGGSWLCVCLCVGRPSGPSCPWHTWQVTAQNLPIRCCSSWFMCCSCDRRAGKPILSCPMSWENTVCILSTAWKNQFQDLSSAFSSCFTLYVD